MSRICYFSFTFARLIGLVCLSSAPLVSFDTGFSVSSGLQAYFFIYLLLRWSLHCLRNQNLLLVGMSSICSISSSKITALNKILGVNTLVSICLFWYHSGLLFMHVTFDIEQFSSNSSNLGSPLPIIFDREHSTPLRGSCLIQSHISLYSFSLYASLTRTTSLLNIKKQPTLILVLTVFSEPLFIFQGVDWTVLQHINCWLVWVFRY